MITMSFAADIEQALRSALREVNYTFRVTYKDMAKNSGFNENTLKSFVNNEMVRLPDERETAYCLLRLSVWLSEEKDCDIIANMFSAPNKHTCQNGSASVNGDLGDEIRGIAEQNGRLSVADKTNSISDLEEIAKELGKYMSAVNAEIALKKQG